MQNLILISAVVLLVLINVGLITAYFTILKKAKSDFLKFLFYLLVIIFGVGLPLYVFSRIFVAYKTTEDYRFLAFIFWAVPSLCCMIWQKSRNR
jgi:hypothetical protein